MSASRPWTAATAGLAALTATAGVAQELPAGRPLRGWSLSPSLSLTYGYDDNLFSDAERRRDRVARARPGLRIAWRSATVSATARYSADAEHFAEHPTLTAARSRDEGSLAAGFTGRRMEAWAEGSVVRTTRPNELFPETGLDLARAEVLRRAAHSYVSYRWRRRLQISLTHSSILDALVAGPREEAAAPEQATHVGRLKLEHRASPRHTLGVAYAVRYYRLADARLPLSHVLAADWTHRLDERSSVHLSAGPRLSRGVVEPEIDARLTRSSRNGSLTLALSRTEAAVVGEPRPLRVDSAGIVLRQGLRAFELTLAPGLFASRGAGRPIRVYRARLEVAAQVARWLRIAASHDFSVQHGRSQDGIRHGVTELRVVLGEPD